MKWKSFGLPGIAGGFVLAIGLVANAASNSSLSLTGFTGDSSQSGTQTALATAGLNAFSTGAPEAVTFDANGAHFGSVTAGDAGRNYVRTNDSNYSTVPFVAEITFEADDAKAVFFGLGAGDTALFGTPDWSTQFSSASFWPETNNDKFVQFRTQNDTNVFVDTNVPGFSPGAHRFRMTFDPATNSLTGAIDTNYAGGPFVADVTGVPNNTTTLFAADGWPSEPSRIFFGGDDGAVFRDLVIRVIPEPSTAALLLLAFAAMAGRRIRDGR